MDARKKKRINLVRAINVELLATNIDFVLLRVILGNKMTTAIGRNGIFGEFLYAASAF